MTEDNSRDTDHHHTPGGSEDLRPCTVFTRRWYRIALQELLPLVQPLVCVIIRQCDTVVPFLSFKLAALAVAPPQLMGFEVSWGLKWSSAASLGTGGVVMW